ATAARRVEGINPADLTRQITVLQMKLMDLAQAKTQALTAARGLDMKSLNPSINRLTQTK
ncbi:MAG: hypothetical protein ACR2FV_05550, partial [Ornithinimicrobium sp.]|uniref:hypothetical protein n=1 Tax=Ornithinimicrobium sp. TaxID=1977084 RepID=UPI003D9BF638